MYIYLYIYRDGNRIDVNLLLFRAIYTGLRSNP